MAQLNAKSFVNITDIAEELLIYIFRSDCLKYQDILSLSQCCRRFFEVTRCNEIWRQKLTSRWKKWNYHFSGDDVQEVFKERICLEISVKNELLSIADRAYFDDEVQYSLLDDFNEKFCKSKMKSDMLLDVLHVFTGGRDHKGDLNIEYYARRVYRYVYHQHLKAQWMELLNSEEEEDIYGLEKGAVLISQWCNPFSRFSREEVSQKLDEIADLIKSGLKSDIVYPSAPTYEEAKEILETINGVLFGDLEFKGNQRNYYNLKNSYIHQVLKRKEGIPITLSILYISIAKRIGLNLEGINFPGHFLARIMVSKNGEPSPVYIDAYHKGELLDEGQLLVRAQQQWPPRDVIFEVAPMRKVFIRMVNNILGILRNGMMEMQMRHQISLRSAHELMLLLAPEDNQNKLQLVDIYLRQGITLSDVTSPLRGSSYSMMFPYDIEEQERQHRVEKPKYRSHPEHQNVIYRVGMIMKHKRYNYYCVIYGWDPDCRMDNSWQLRMGIDNLEDKAEQPFYHVLVQDSSSRYAAQENLLPAQAACPILHPETGKYFKTFNGFQYIWTSKLSECYPEDQPIPEEDLPDRDPNFIKEC